jgi:hypothetical protein
MGAVVLGVPTMAQTPLSGHFSPVLAVVPNGAFMVNSLILRRRMFALSEKSSE